MYTVFYDNRQLVLQSTAEKLQNADLVLNLDGNENQQVLQSIVDAFQDNTRTVNVCLRSTALQKTWNTYRKLYNEIAAAGGVVYNKEGRLLLIFRLGKWDLPKGKLDKGEDAASAAIREVEEECGISNLTILQQLPSVYHTYEQKGKKYMKETSWYEMSSTYEGTLVPQEDEGITDVKWFTRKEGIIAMENTWASIRSLLKLELENTSRWK